MSNSNSYLGDSITKYAISLLLIVLAFAISAFAPGDSVVNLFKYLLLVLGSILILYTLICNIVDLTSPLNPVEEKIIKKYIQYGRGATWPYYYIKTEDQKMSWLLGGARVSKEIYDKVKEGSKVKMKKYRLSGFIKEIEI